jgi:hypothetical protein
MVAGAAMSTEKWPFGLAHKFAIACRWRAAALHKEHHGDLSPAGRRWRLLTGDIADQSSFTNFLP